MKTFKFFITNPRLALKCHIVYLKTWLIWKTTGKTPMMQLDELRD
jgi:hypothetical protein